MPPELIERRILTVVEGRLAEAPVVLLQGARSVGKSTVLADLARQHDVAITDLDDPAVRDRVEASPSEAVRGPAPVCIDEYQHVPALLQAIKAELNKQHENGRWLLTGSTSFWAMPRGTQSLTGRLQILEVMPFSQGELDSDIEDFLDVACTNPARLVEHGHSDTDRAEYERRLCRGGMPLAVHVSEQQRANFYQSYLDASLTRDILDLSRVRQINVLPRLMERVAAQTGQVLNIVKASTDAGVEPRSGDNYVRLLEALFLIRRLPAWGRTLRSRTAHSPKLHVIDSGLAAHILGVTPDKLARRDPAALSEFGHLLETFVVGEILKQASWSESIRQLGHWRTHSGHEVDLVAEAQDGGVVGFEVKAGREVDKRTRRGLAALRDALGDQFRAGFILNTGNEAYSIDDRIYVCPIDRLWRPTHRDRQATGGRKRVRR
jgi:predicted AAA+ superfamily ATPase